MPVVTSLKLANKRKQTVEISLDGEPWMTVDAEVIVRLGICRESELGESELRAIEREERFVQARRAAVNRCVLRPRTEREIARLLNEKGCDDALAERVFRVLREQQLLDDRQVAQKSAVKARRAAIGPRKIDADLAARGVDEAIRREELASIRDPRWQTREAESLARKRLSRLPDATADEKFRKTGAYLLRRGFDSEIVADVLRRIIGEEPPDA